MRCVFDVEAVPTTPADAYQLAVLWAGVSEAALSHETALLVRDLCDVNPDRIHLTVARNPRIRRRQPAPCAVHCSDIDERDLGWWEGIRIVCPATAIRQCIAYGTPAHQLRQALTQARTTGLITEAERHVLNQMEDHGDPSLNSGRPTSRTRQQSSSQARSPGPPRVARSRCQRRSSNEGWPRSAAAPRSTGAGWATSSQRPSWSRPSNVHDVNTWIGQIDRAITAPNSVQRGVVGWQGGNP